MKRLQTGIIATMCLSLWTLTGCDRDSIDNVTFEVKTKNDPGNIRVGETVTFLFDGNAEYITFFSGENGNNYANMSRDSVSLSALQMTCKIKQQYTDKEYRGKEIIHAYLSENFNGKYELSEIQKADWQPISGKEYNQLAVPLTVASPTEEVNSGIDLSGYVNKAFHVAFQYNAPKRSDVPTSAGNGRYVTAPRIDISPLSLKKTTVEEETVVWSNPSTDWAFRVIYEKSTQTSNYSVGDGGLLFQPQEKKEHTDDDVIVWMVSGKIQPWKVEPDRGVPIKSTEAALNSYTHIYNKAGEYVVTFIATNANLWNSDRIVRQIRLTVKE